MPSGTSTLTFTIPDIVTSPSCIDEGLRLRQGPPPFETSSILPGARRRTWGSACLLFRAIVPQPVSRSNGGWHGASVRQGRDLAHQLAPGCLLLAGQGVQGGEQAARLRDDLLRVRVLLQFGIGEATFNIRSGRQNPQ